MCRDFFGGMCRRKSHCVYKHFFLKCDRPKCGKDYCKLLHLPTKTVDRLNVDGPSFPRSEEIKKELMRVCYYMYQSAPNKEALCFSQTIGSPCRWPCVSCKRYELEFPQDDYVCYADIFNQPCTWNCSRCVLRTAEEQEIVSTKPLVCNRCLVPLVSHDIHIIDCPSKHAFCEFCIKKLTDTRCEALGVPQKICCKCGEGAGFYKIFT